MESPKDTTNKMLQEQEQKKKTNIAIWKKPTKFKSTCIICKKEFEFEAIPKSQIEAMRWENGWEKPTKSYCSKKCYEIAVEENKLSKYKKWLKEILPLRFINIECDKRDLIQKGINESIFITGNTGVGKTVLMAGIAKKIIKENFELYYKEKAEKERRYLPLREHEENYGVKWISYPGFIMKLQSMFRKDGENTPFELAESIAAYPGTLCIDDMGAEKMTAFVQQITYYIINYREQEMLHTLITSNFSLGQIDEQVDTRVSSRISGMCKIIKLTGRDRRLE